MDTAEGILNDIAGVGTGNTAAGICGRAAAVGGRAAAVDVFANICGPCALALGCMHQTAVQEFADRSGL